MPSLPAPLLPDDRLGDMPSRTKQVARVSSATVDRAPTDAELVRRASSGERWAEEAIYRRYVQYVASIVGREARSSQDVGDVIQDTFVSAFEQIRSLREGDALRVWLARIAVSRVRRLRRWRGLLGRLGVEPQGDCADWAEVPDARGGPDIQAEIALLDRALGAVPSDARLAWTLHRVHGESLEDVSKVLGCSLATTKRRMAAADAEVSRHFGQQEAP
jgi:RNA polymerase sigma-70 factor, ECF subfamily